MEYNTKDVSTPRDGYTVYMNRYWVCVDGDPKQALFYGDSPQCNRNKYVPETMLSGGTYKGQRYLEVVFLETAYLQVRR